MPGPYAIGPDAATGESRRDRKPAAGRSKPRGPHLHSGRCPSSRSAPTSGCPRRSTRGIRAPGTSRSTSPAWSRPRGPGRSPQHVGSSSVPGMPGKNVVDLGVEADPDEIPEITDTLLSLGFQRQSGLAPFPPTRPLMLGNVDHDGTSFRVHLHVMPPARHELAELLAFRDALRADPALRDGYAEVEAASSWRPRPTATPTCCTRSTRAASCSQALYRLGIRKGPADAPDPLAAGLDDRDPRGRAARPDAGDRRARDGLPDGRPRPRPGLPGRVGRRRDRRRRATTTSRPRGGWPRWPTS